MLSNLNAQSNRSSTDVMVRQSDGSYVVNTTTLAKDVIGFRGNTPLKLYIKDNKIIKVEPLPNHETPSFFDKVKKGLLSKWCGMKVSKVSATEMDGVTGATFSSKAVKENVKRGAKYYMKHK
ncbi:MAG: FMN-binding protein [Prevotellaceae bacterium]|uniref:FMN-binding protein n=1 Tax=Prevotella sp. TaxID=59823 RepID=UPI002A2F911E|nr:FMN-binding protein [Prevotella sp.]MDD7318135.1 FMN-binding protein [Prevotellaceae bacterium]